jgi:hypothetical protein
VQATPVPIVKEAGWAPGLVSTGTEKKKSVYTAGLRSPNRLDRSKSLYRLLSPGRPRNGCSVVFRSDCQIHF